MPANKKHHYVPRFYLRQFASDGQSVSLFNFRQGRSISGANLRNQCYRDYMYGKDGEHEYNLSQIEGALSTLLKHILSTETLPPPITENHESLCILVLLQYARTAYSADASDEFADKMWKKVLEKDPRFGAEMLSKVRIVHTDPANFAVAMILTLYHLIMDMDFRLLKACDGTEFITSDNPAVMYNQLMEFETIGGNTGLASKGLQIFFPLSPKYMLVFFDRAVYAYRPRRSIVIEVPTPQDMLQLNGLQVVSASENVYFFSPKADIFRVVAATKRFRRKRKARIIALPERPTATGSSQIIGGSRENICTKLSLSFVRLIEPAKLWLKERKSHGMKQMAVVRDPGLLRAHETFSKHVEAGRYGPTEFFKYLREKGSG
jgi:hypothetical protein